MQPMRDTETPGQAHREGIVASPRRPRQETARLGKELYERVGYRRLRLVFSVQ